MKNELQEDTLYVKLYFYAIMVSLEPHRNNYFKKTYKITQSLIFEVTISVDSVYNYQTGVITTVSFSGTRKKPGKWTSYNNQAALFLGVSPTILG